MCLFGSVVTAQTLEDAMDINTSGIMVQRLRMTIVAENLANIMTLKDEETGLPYQKKICGFNDITKRRSRQKY